MIDAEFVAVDFQTTRSLSEIGTFGNSTGEFAYIWQSKWVGTMRWRLNEREFTFSAMFLLPSPSLDPKVCTWRHGGHVGSQEQTHFSPLLGTQLYFHVDSSISNSIVLTPNMATLSRGCKPRVWERGGHFFAVLSVTTYFYSITFRHSYLNIMERRKQRLVSLHQVAQHFPVTRKKRGWPHCSHLRLRAG